jgi:glycine C-acetyltransferase
MNTCLEQKKCDAMRTEFFKNLSAQLEEIKENGLYKKERIITSPQQAKIKVQNGQGKEVLNFCANNYLGLANHPDLVKAAEEAIAKYGFGMASVRFICGTLDIHKELESRLSRFLGTEDTILYSSCFDANGGLFETLLTEDDAIISDSLNHASIIDGIRLCKAKRFRYNNNDMADLEMKLKEAQDCRVRMIATDGVFSMDGIIANLKEICRLADKYDALVMVDDCHAAGFMGEKGKGTHEHCGVMGRIDIITGTLGKALGGASGGYTSGRKEVIEMLRQRSRPYLFSNTLVPAITATSLKVLDILESSDHLIKKLFNNARYFRSAMENLGFNLVPGEHPIIPVMLGDAKLASQMADRLLEEGIYVIGFSFPVVPKGQARIRTQISAGHDKNDLDRAIEAFAKAGRELGVIK